MKERPKRKVQHYDHFDIEENFNGIWAVTLCNLELFKPVEFDDGLKPHQRYYRNHKEEISKKQKAARDYNFPNKLKSGGQFSKYGMTNEDYENMYEDQDGRCAICKNRSIKKLVVDHDHTNGKVRGLLCNKCNVGIGLLQDSPELLEIARIYILAHK